MGMKTQDAINHFGSQHQLADALGLKQPSICKWGDFPPELRQLQIESLSAGALKADKSILPSRKTNLGKKTKVSS